MSNTTLVRVTGLTAEEWREFKSLAALRGIGVGQMAADALRAVLKGAKP